MDRHAPTRPGLARAIARAYLALCAVTLLSAAIATAAGGRLTGPLEPATDPARHGLRVAGEIYVTNARAAVIVLGCAVLVGWVPAWRAILDVSLAALAGLNTVVVWSSPTSVDTG